ncbi:hypothetical protein COV11_00320 [Candidatus Woesearchaeota archaeon CG10_big_fil_rev_8_21_14_0_10_30_7]|nr:MAG: hypothetical protein COV11_00320 [Candidatus Woesearchaeota archaeon CG10_big_fil_rev_8_21_14_0_10_30_7]
MDFVKAKYDQINWETEGKLYRGTFQAVFERRLLESFLKDNPSYYGFKFNTQYAKLTSCSTDFIDAVIYSCNRDPERVFSAINKRKPSLWPFTRYPFIIEINASNYKDDLYFGLESRELIIQGDINFKDIKILFSAEQDNFDSIPENLQGKIKRALELTLIGKNFSKEESLLNYLHNEKDEIITVLRPLIFGMNLSICGEKINSLVNSIDFLIRILNKKKK